MWAALNDIAVERGKTVHDAILETNRGLGISLTAAIRRLYRRIPPRSASPLSQRKSPAEAGPS
jgi:hypothetical protein